MHLPSLPQPVNIASASPSIELKAPPQYIRKPPQKRPQANQIKLSSPQYTWEVGALYLY